MNFLEKSLNILSRDTISVLEIATYNTTGLKGAKEKVSSPFNNLVKSSGVSNKSDDAGGSFGIGKNAPYTCSTFRTVLYSTLDEENILAVQGVAKLVTHKQDNRDTQGTGFLGITEKDQYEDIINRPFIDAEVMKNLDELFIRKEVGTSLFVMGFEKDDTWKEDIIKVTIDFYMMAILEEKLEVLVQDIIINKDTIESIIVKGENTHYREDDFKGMGKIKLYILLDKNLPKKVAYIRSNGMKIIDKGIYVNDIELLIPEKQGTETDLENCTRIYNAMKNLNIQTATEERVWAYLTHNVFWDYMRKRWPVEDETINRVL